MVNSIGNTNGHMKFNRNNIAIPIEFQFSFQWIHVEISMKHQRKSIGNPVKISMKNNLKIQWYTNGNPVGIQ